MPFFEIFKSRNQCFWIGKWFVLIRRFRFLFNNDVGMRIKIIFVVKINRADNTKSIGHNAKFVGIAEMAIHILLFYFMISCCRRRHRTVGCFVRVIRIIKVISFCIGFKLLDDTVSVFWIIFSHIRFNTWSIKQKHRGELTINVLTDWFRNIYKIIKNGL